MAVQPKRPAEKNISALFAEAINRKLKPQQQITPKAIQWGPGGAPTSVARTPGGEYRADYTVSYPSAYRPADARMGGIQYTTQAGADQSQFDLRPVSPQAHGDPYDAGMAELGKFDILPDPTVRTYNPMGPQPKTPIPWEVGFSPYLTATPEIPPGPWGANAWTEDDRKEEDAKRIKQAQDEWDRRYNEEVRKAREYFSEDD